jgi:hypothetical protein
MQKLKQKKSWPKLKWRESPPKYNKEKKLAKIRTKRKALQN